MQSVREGFRNRSSADGNCFDRVCIAGVYLRRTVWVFMYWEAAVGINVNVPTVLPVDPGAFTHHEGSLQRTLFPSCGHMKPRNNSTAIEMH